MFKEEDFTIEYRILIKMINIYHANEYCRAALMLFFSVMLECLKNDRGLEFRDATIKMIDELGEDGIISADGTNNNNLH